MLKKGHRLRTMRDFRLLYKKGSSFGNRHLMAKILKKPDQEYSRFAFVISAKTEKRAVHRNRAKRQLREIIKAELAELKSGHDVALTIKAGFLPLDFENKTKTTRDLLKKAKLYK